MENINDLRDELIEIFNKLKENKIKGKEAKELINCAGKIISSAKVQIDYAKMKKTDVDIEFLEEKKEKNGNKK